MEENKEVSIEEVSISDDAATDNHDTETIANDAPIDVKDAQIAELTDKYLRIAAELENTRRRAAIDAESAARTRAIGVVRQFLPVMDAIVAALKHNPNDSGIDAMARAMDSAFEQIGIKKIESVGKPLNPTYHNAIQVIAAPTDMTPVPAPNTILEEMQTGYTFGDAVLRPAMVIVAK